MVNHPRRNKRLFALQASHAELLEALKRIAELETRVGNPAYAAFDAQRIARAAIARAESLTTNQ